jgi:ADP-ribose pyrophosphatase YjhB (NUDIX family)
VSNLWNVGANYAADAVVATEDGYVLLIKRGDNGEWAFPGGFINPDEFSWNAAAREAQEEAGIDFFLTYVSSPRFLFNGKVDDHRNTDDRWVETTAYLFTIPERVEVKGGDDATEAAWVTVEEAEKTLTTTHAPIMRAFVSWIRS